MEKLSIEINFGGRFVRGQRMRYVGGQKAIVDNCDIDKMSLFEIHDILRETGITQWNSLQYCQPRLAMNKGLKSLDSDVDILAMVASMDSKKYVKNYVEQEMECNANSIQSVQPKETYMLQYDVHEEGVMQSSQASTHDADVVVENVEFDINSVSASLNEDVSHDDTTVEEEMRDMYEEFTSTSKDVTVGMKFGTLKELKELVKENAIKNGQNIKFVKHEVERLTATCIKGCKWSLHASKLQNEATFQIKTYKNVHTCPRSLKNRHASSKWVANKYLQRFKSQPDWPVSSIVETVRSDYGINISTILAYRARKHAREFNDGDGKGQYNLLMSYAAELRKTNPGSSFFLDLESTISSTIPTFRRAYLCFDACQKGLLNGGRPLLCLDGCHLKGQCTGQLLTAVGIDANDGIYPVAVCVVESECTASWNWFLQLVVNDLGISNGGIGWMLISDQQKGLVKTLGDIVPQAEIRFCLRHLYANFKIHFKGKFYKDAMMCAARATTFPAFEKEMNDLKDIDMLAYQHLMAQDPKTWAKHAFSHVPKCDISLNNLSESFNALLLPARDKPILTMLEMIRKMLMTRIFKKHQHMEKYEEVLCPKVTKKIAKLVETSRHWHYIPAGGDRFEISDPKERYVVDLKGQTCTCCAWTLTGVPCVHAVTCLVYMRVTFPFKDFVHQYYHRATYLKMYSYFMSLINAIDMWPPVEKNEIIPPEFKRQPGRPKRKRVRDANEPPSQTAHVPLLRHRAMKVAQVDEVLEAADEEVEWDDEVVDNEAVGEEVDNQVSLLWDFAVLKTLAPKVLLLKGVTIDGCRV